jgi:DNA-binding transcriptional regulator YhcF (GntR family)
MKIWISKNSEVPVGEQLIAQIKLGIAAGDLEVGAKLPSTREIARRCDLHSNTVSSAYQKLVEQKLLEFKKGSGFYVTESASERIEGTRKLELLVQDFLASAKSLGFDESDVIELLQQPREARASGHAILIESDEALREILLHELSDHNRNTTGISFEDYSKDGAPVEATLVAMLDEKPKIDPMLNRGQNCIYLKGRSVSATMSGENRPGADEIVAVVSRWQGFLSFARIMLLAANIDPGRLVIRSTADDGWRDSIKHASIVVCDSLTAASLGGSNRVREFRIISDESLNEFANATTRS